MAHVVLGARSGCCGRALQRLKLTSVGRDACADANAREAGTLLSTVLRSATMRRMVDKR